MSYAEREKHLRSENDSRLQLNLMDYVARQNNNTYGRFTSVDPLAEISYELSPYAYVENNPLRWIDPTGMKKGDPDEPIELDEVVVSAQRPSSSTHFHMVMFSLMSRELYRLSMTTPTSYSIHKDNYYPAIINDLTVSYEFLTGTGPQSRKFGENNSSTKSLRRSHLTIVALSKIKALIAQGQTKGFVNIGFNPLESQDSGPFSSFLFSLSYTTDQMVGSARYDYEVVGSNIDITVSNATSIHSALYHAPGTGKPKRSETPLGIGGNVNQTYTFTVPYSTLTIVK